MASRSQVISIKMIDYSSEVLAAVNAHAQLGLNAVGEKMELHAKERTPVDTGRLRDSITYATRTKHSSPGAEAKVGDATPRGSVPDMEVQLGTNVEYAETQEYGDSIKHRVGAAHFLRDAAANHNSEYEAILEAALDM